MEAPATWRSMRKLPVSFVRWCHNTKLTQPAHRHLRLWWLRHLINHQFRLKPLLNGPEVNIPL